MKNMLLFVAGITPLMLFLCASGTENTYLLVLAGRASAAVALGLLALITYLFMKEIKE